jgi:dihydroorotate dehydrogenase (fumarate)/dihydroorotate dehydrogenase
LLFRIDPERVHHLTTLACQVAGRMPPVLGMIERQFGAPPDPRLETTVLGVRFANPVGLSAGYDKTGKTPAVLSRMGFGYLDIGSVSRWPSPGNAGRPRLFRLPADDMLVVNYGVPSDGAEAVAQRLARKPSRVPIGVTLVETNTGKPSAPGEVIAEIAAAFEPFRGLVDVLFISAYCPNETSGARPFADPGNLRRLFEALGRIPDLPPVVLKIKAYGEQIDRVVEAAAPFPFVRGFLPSVAPARPYAGLRTPAAAFDAMPGTATGPYSKPYLLDDVREWYTRIDRARHIVIANGGIRSGADAYAAIRAGASLVGLVTALVYQGPGIARRINRELSALLQRDGFAHVADAVGVDATLRERTLQAG